MMKDYTDQGNQRSITHDLTKVYLHWRLGEYVAVTGAMLTCQALYNKSSPSN